MLISIEQQPDYDMAFASVIVCAHNRLTETTIPCLQNLREVTQAPFELICIDDGSKDQGATIAYFSEVADKAIRLPKNRGLSAARNLGFMAAEGSLIIFLDNDMFPPPGWIWVLREEIVKDSRIGILAAIPSNEVSRLKKPARQDGLIDFAHISGACMAITPECHAAVGFFDERMINNGEDTDFCYRATERGFRICSTPRLIIRHENGATRKHMDKGQMRQASRYMRKKYAHRPDLPMPPLSPFGSIFPIIP